MGKLFASKGKMKDALVIVCVILLILWALGLTTSYYMGGAIHFLAVIAVILFVIWLVSGRNKIL